MSIPFPSSPLGIQTEKRYPIGTAIFTVYGDNGNQIDYPVNLNEITNGQYLFSGYSTLEHIPEGVTFEKLTNAYNMFNGCLQLQLPQTVDFSKVTNGQSMFSSCQIYGEYENLNFGSLSNGTNFGLWSTFSESFVYCVLNTIPQLTSAASLHLGYRTNFRNSEKIASLLETTTPIGTSYTFKGWNIRFQ